jgi:putative acetyltransferase
MDRRGNPDRDSDRGDLERLLMATIVRAETAEHFDWARSLISEYAASLPVDVSYEHVPEECARLPGEYAPPRGALLLALAEGAPAGCIALRPLDVDVCEMKRVYLRPAWRGRGIGRALAVSIVESARRIGYRRMRLDTIPAMKPAIALYRSMGFRVIAPYRAIPTACAFFMELDLAQAPLGAAQ